MNEGNLKILAEDLLDFLNGLEASTVKMKMQIAKLIGVYDEKRKWSWNPNAIKWEKAQGAKCDFERSEDVNSQDFKALLKIYPTIRGS